MEALTRLVTDSLARYGFDRPVDPRRLQWSRWFRCDSPRSLLIVPSKPGIFAIAEEVLGGAALQRDSPSLSDAASAADASPVKRMLAVLQFSEDDDMAFTLDRMFTRINPMRARLSSGRCFLRFVVIEDQGQRRNICGALNQWMINSTEKATGIPPDFSSSLELTTDRVGTDAACPEPSRRVRPANTTDRVGRTLPSAGSGQALSDAADSTSKPAQAMPQKPEISTALDTGSAKNLHCPYPLPSGF
jgi:hypothetical protein